MLKCQACGGTYAAELVDGTPNFHACPPLSRSELAAAVDAGTITLPKGETVDDAVARRTYARANARDENIDLAKLQAYRKAHPTVKVVDIPDEAIMRAPGAGAVDVADP